MNNKGFLLIALTFAFGQSFAQYTETITTSRPGASFTPFTTGAKIFQVQSGFVYDASNEGDDYKRKGISYVLIGRYGLSESFELRSSVIFRNDKEELLGVENSYGGLALWDIGMRWNMIDGTSSGTSLGLQTEFKINGIGPDEYSSNQLTSRTIALFSTPITDWLSFTSNLGVSWYDFVGNPNGLYTLNLAFPYSSKFGGFIEMYGAFTSEFFGTSFDTGVGYLVNNNFMLDVTFGFVELIDSPFVDIGFSWRTSR